jgi:hypothetical protein
VKAFLTSFVFLVLIVFIVCADHLIDAIIGRNYGKIVLYGLLSLLLLLAVIALIV